MAKHPNWQKLVPAVKQLHSSSEGRQVWRAMRAKSSEVVHAIAAAPEQKMKHIEHDPRFQKAANSLATVVKAAVRLSPSLDPYVKDLATLAIEIKLLELNQRQKEE